MELENVPAFVELAGKARRLVASLCLRPHPSCSQSPSPQPSTEAIAAMPWQALTRRSPLGPRPLPSVGLSSGAIPHSSRRHCSALYRLGRALLESFVKPSSTPRVRGGYPTKAGTLGRSAASGSRLEPRPYSGCQHWQRAPRRAATARQPPPEGPSAPLFGAPAVAAENQAASRDHSGVTPSAMPRLPEATSTQLGLVNSIHVSSLCFLSPFLPQSPCSS